MLYVYPCCPVFAAPYRNPSPAPPIHADILTASAKEAAGMLEDARLLLARLSASQELASRILTAAQSSDAAAVKRLIKQTGIKNDFDVTFNPDGIRVSLFREQSRFIIALRWSA
ncbi:hypothetical protein QRX25_15305 [Bacillus sp. L381]|uniref:hypothetical protein n=1 Tax=Bacillus TaxID=1386 RepID=UPI000E259B35|nr:MULTISPECIES: hypothetical protein [Bacillus]MCR9039301.1 hypothetical protein [Bacillus velezensis]QUN08842.1 hypothetical protein KEF49_15100 [Bacillus amyloliquefaciens]QYM81916.1 hypothetical protein KTJ85_14950 [Bacillus sp. 7D3]QZY11149.1 hypothetical protein K7B13_15665 [Bacillus amyloliquefaciens]RDY91016.1 hypothetical protein C3733_04580 [Bacillus amyloliquefaciens]